MTPDQDWRPTATRAALAARAALLARARAFLSGRGVIEVETPALSRAAAPDLHLASLVVDAPDGAASGNRYLQTSPEYPLKRLLAAGHGDCFALAKVWRVGEVGSHHQPEFTMLEWYRVGWDHRRLMAEVAELIAALLAPRLTLAPPEVVTYRDAFLQHLGVDPLTAADLALDALMAGSGFDAQMELDRDGKLDLLGSHLVYPRLGQGRVTLLTDFPASQCALARLRPGRDGGPAVAERFEAFVAGIELANGYHELADVVEQRARFESANGARLARGLPAMPLDQRLLAALAHGLPDCAGVALGFDRVVMLALGAGALDEVIAFPWARA
jgi:lysyl-tRNA synthetase class 2